MNRKIHFTKETTFLGRNGEFKAVGLYISTTTISDEVIIEPVTSKGLTGRAMICVPQSSIPELIDTLRLFLEGGSDTAPDPKAEKIAYIKKVIIEWGNTSCCDLELDHSPSMNSLGGGRVCELVEQFYADSVETIVYDDDIELSYNNYEYEELSDELIDEIYEIIQNYEADMLKTEKRCQD